MIWDVIKKELLSNFKDVTGRDVQDLKNEINANRAIIESLHERNEKLENRMIEILESDKK